MSHGTSDRDGVELRVHGVGGDPPHTVLGMPHREDAVPEWRTAGNRVAVAHRRGDPNVRVFGWGDLTSRSAWFALWTLLLPFTLMNVAGWAGRRWDRFSTPFQWLCRAIASLCALVLTALTVGWIALTGLLLLPAAHQEWGLALAAVATTILGVCTTFVSTLYERHQPPWWAEEEDGQKILTPLNLSSPRFFDSATAHRRAWRAHVAVAVVAWAAIGVRYATDQDTLTSDLEMGIAWTTFIGLALVALLGVASFKRDTSADDWRWSAPALTAGAAFFLTGGVPAAALIARNGGLEGFRGRHAFLFLDLYGASLAAALGVALVVAGVVFLRKSPAEREDREAKPAKERLLFSSKARRAARKAQAFRHIDLAATALVSTFVMGGIAAFVLRVSRPTTALSWDASPGRQLVWLALSALGFVVGFLVRDLWRNSRSLDRRRKIGQLWDVLTFWPRVVHPFAVRPYAERAVPELQEYLSRRGFAPPRDRWTVTAHSQGSILVYAALLGTPRGEWSTTPIDLLTFGSPLATLYARAFARYFSVEGFAGVRRELETHWDEKGKGSWRNVLRATDAVGREVFTVHFSQRDKNLDFALGDSNQEEPRADDCAPDGEYDLPTDGKVWGHSGYRRARRFKMLVHRSRFGRGGCDARS